MRLFLAGRTPAAPGMEAVSAAGVLGTAVVLDPFEHTRGFSPLRRSLPRSRRARAAVRARPQRFLLVLYKELDLCRSSNRADCLLLSSAVLRGTRSAAWAIHPRGVRR